MLPEGNKCSHLKELFLYLYVFLILMITTPKRTRKILVQIALKNLEKDNYFFNNLSIIISYDSPFFPLELSFSFVLSLILMVVYPESFFSILLYFSYIFYRYYRLYINFSANLYILLIYRFYRFYRPLESGIYRRNKKCMK